MADIDCSILSTSYTTQMAFNNPVPVVVALVRVLGSESGRPRLLAVRRKNAPGAGGLALPGGYVDEGESAEQAICREIEEEACLQLPPHYWKPVITRITPDNRLLIFMLCDHTLTERDLDAFLPNNEVSELVTVSESTVLVFPLHEQVLRSGLWLRNT